MSEAYVGELRIFSFGLIPKNWASCNGQLLSISSNQALFSLLGTTYGGDGRNTFGLPNLRGVAPVHWGTSNSGAGNPYWGQSGGEEQHILAMGEMPPHTHPALGASNAVDQTVPTGNVLGSGGLTAYAAPGSLVPMSSGAIGSGGGGQGHENRQPFLPLNICICLFGIFPSRS